PEPRTICRASPSFRLIRQGARKSRSLLRNRRRPRRRSSQRFRCAAFPCPARHRVPRRMWACRRPIRFRSVWPMSARCRPRRFAQASGEPAPQVASGDVAVAAVPVPSFRPQMAPASDNASALLALASDDAVPTADTLAVVPSARPGDEVKALLEEAGDEEYQIAAIPTPRSAFADPTGVDAASASPRAAAIGKPADPAGAIGGNVKTTRKSARPTAEVARSEPRAVVVSAEPERARWALNS